MKHAIILTALMSVTAPALACEYCLGTGEANAEIVRALVFSMVSLLAVIGFVGGSIGTFFFKIHQRTKKLELENDSH